MAKTIDDDKKKIGEVDDPGKNKDDDLSSKDTSKFTDEQKNDYIAQLKDENARRRIENKKVKEQISQFESAQEKATKTLEELSKKVESYEKSEKEKSLSEKTEIEKVKIRMEELEKEISTRDGKIKTLESELSVKDLRIQEASRERMIDRLCSQLEISFTSDYERRGLLIELLERKGTEFSFNDDEVIHKLQTLAKDRKKVSPVNTPGPGPQSRITGTPLVERIKALTSKEHLNTEDQKELKELLAEVEKARSGQG